MSFSLAVGITLGPSNTGKTLNAKLFDQAGALVATITTGFFELDATNLPGQYGLWTTAVPDGHTGWLGVWVVGEPNKNILVSINPSEVENADTKTTAVMTTQMTESYAADGVEPTPAQALFLIQQMFTEFFINHVTLTVRKLDGSSIAATLTMDSATNPTQLTRTT